MVWLHSPVVQRGKSRKFHHPWTGPWRITKRLSDVTYRIRDCNRRHRQVVVHFDRLKPCTPGTDVKTGSEQPRPPATAANVEHYQLELVDDSDYEEDPFHYLLLTNKERMRIPYPSMLLLDCMITLIKKLPQFQQEDTLYGTGDLLFDMATSLHNIRVRDGLTGSNHRY